MDFNLSEEQIALQHTARRFVQEQMVKVAREMEVSDSGVPVNVRMRMAEMGFLGINVAEKYGGVGLGNLEAILVIEEFAKISTALAFPIFES